MKPSGVTVDRPAVVCRCRSGGGAAVPHTVAARGQDAPDSALGDTAGSRHDRVRLHVAGVRREGDPGGPRRLGCCDEQSLTEQALPAPEDITFYEGRGGGPRRDSDLLGAQSQPPRWPWGTLRATRIWRSAAARTTTFGYPSSEQVSGERLVSTTTTP